jgi:hypothetical protein
LKALNVERYVYEKGQGICTKITASFGAKREKTFHGQQEVRRIPGFQFFDAFYRSGKGSDPAFRATGPFTNCTLELQCKHRYPSDYILTYFTLLYNNLPFSLFQKLFIPASAAFNSLSNIGMKNTIVGAMRSSVASELLMNGHSANSIAQGLCISERHVRRSTSQIQRNRSDLVSLSITKRRDMCVLKSRVENFYLDDDVSAPSHSKTVRLKYLRRIRVEGANHIVNE